MKVSFRDLFVRVSRRAAGCAFALLVTSAISAHAQPLIDGTEIGANRFFVEGEKLKRLTAENKVFPTTVDASSDTQLLQPSAWGKKALLVLSDTKAVLVSETANQDIELKLPEKPKSDDEEKTKLKSASWGEFVVVHFPGTQDLQLIRADGSVELLETDSPVKSFHVLDSDTLLLLTQSGELQQYSPQDLGTPIVHRTGLGEKYQLTISGESALLWSEDSLEISLVKNDKFITRTLREMPSKGVKSLGNNEFVLLLPHYLAHLNKYTVLRSLAVPGVLTKDNQALARFFTDKDNLHFLFENSEEGLTSMKFDSQGKVAGGLLGQQTIKTLILPNGAQAHRPFLLVETSFEEKKVDFNSIIYEGDAVINPKKEEQENHTVYGHILYMLDRRGIWSTVVKQPRTRVIGAASVIGDTLVYPTQTTPLHTLDADLDVDWEFPHSPVVLQAYNASSGKPSWTSELPRGQAPSPARIPEDSWPTLDKNGPILFTTEDNRLSALDPSSGEVQWTSGELSMDESRPQMLLWRETLGLVATNNTTKKFFLFDNKGSLLASSTLNEIFNSQRKLNLAGVIVICLALLIYIYVAGKKKLFIRRIAGLEALDEAVGRATEMGKPVLYVTGLADVDDIQTLASLSILSHVGKKTAEYDSSIVATTSRAVTFSAAQEVVRDAFTVAGRPDSFSLESVQYISDDQFGYAAGVDGLMLREEPAANFYMGKFYAESLIFAETGHSTGAIQIAGTAQANQLPFFVAACDYTLIGEELFAASAYLSGDPLQVGSLRGQDVGKAIVMILLVLASLYATVSGLAEAGIIVEFWWMKLL